MIDLSKRANFEIARQCFNEELAFRIRSRRNRLLGLLGCWAVGLGWWAADELGLSGAEADAYARSIVVLGIDQPGDVAVVSRVVGDLRASGAPGSEVAVRAELDRLSQIAAMEYAANEPHAESQAA